MRREGKEKRLQEERAKARGTIIIIIREVIRSRHMGVRILLSGLLVLCQRSYSFGRQSARFIAQ